MEAIGSALRHLWSQ
jgi:hypothetical protein